MKKICVVTATRAEYGLLKRIIAGIQKDEDLKLFLVVTGTHLISEYGCTIQEIEDDGFPIAEKIDILSFENGEENITATMAKALNEFGCLFKRQRPDLLVVLGDRYELLPICSAALVENIPIAHIAGGELTEGAIDDTVRHCITKMSYLHFVGCEIYRKRVIQLGESPERVYNVGDTGVENVERIIPLTKGELNRKTGIDFKYPCAVVTFHPVTREAEDPSAQLQELLNALIKFPDIFWIITKANGDKGGYLINQKIEKYVCDKPNMIVVDSLGMENYISLLHYASFVIGNSSSGIIEAPSIGIPTVNIGNRQKGRLRAESIIDCPTKEAAIIKSIQTVLSVKMQKIAGRKKNPYAGGNSSEKIVQIIKKFLFDKGISLEKGFYDLQ